MILFQVFGVTGMLWAAPAADVLALGLTVVYWSCRNGIRSVPGRTGRSHRCRKQDRFRRVERRPCFRQARSDARSEQRRLFRYRDGVFLYAVANQPAQAGSGCREKRTSGRLEAKDGLRSPERIPSVDEKCEAIEGCRMCRGRYGALFCSGRRSAFADGLLQLFQRPFFNARYIRAGNSALGGDLALGERGAAIQAVPEDNDSGFPFFQTLRHALPYL